MTDEEYNQLRQGAAGLFAEYMKETLARKILPEDAIRLLWAEVDKIQEGESK